MKRSKYGAIRTKVDGITFASRKEARRFGELKLLERAGHIHNLTCQRPFPITVNGILVCKYVADFTYYEIPSERYVVEDVKGIKTAIYRLKKKLLLAVYNIEILET